MNDKGQIRRCCLTVAGSDSGGNAGVQADLRAFHSYGLHACTVFAALTAQNPSGVSAIMPVRADFAAAKTGMLADPASIETIAAKLSAHPEIAKVVDPVMVATSGSKLVSGDAVSAIKKLLLPIADVITPNLPEAEALAGVSGGGRSSDSRSAAELARRLFETYGAAVVVKGGHGAGAAAVDVLCDGNGIEEFSLPWIENPVSTHGTGCTFASALAAELALGRSLSEAVRGAKAHVHRAIANAYPVGRDCGVIGFA